MNFKRQNFDDMGDIQKDLESREAARKLIPEMPVIARLDGHGFSKYTRGLNKPFDKRLQGCMQQAMMTLVKEFGADLGYTQSDEITLVWFNRNRNQEFMFGGKIQKIVSLSAASASNAFNIAARDNIPEKKVAAKFDCRVWQVPNDLRVLENILWRQDDAIRNSVTMAAQSICSHKQLMHVGHAKKLDILHEAGIDWNDYNTHFKSGIFCRRFLYQATLTYEQLSKIPEKHRPNGTVERSEVFLFDLCDIRSEENTKELIEWIALKNPRVDGFGQFCPVVYGGVSDYQLAYS